jgi:hypothetical protein
MVKLTAPAMSLDASGSLGGTLVFAKWKGRNYARTLVKPHNPRSASQTGLRAMFQFLTQHWTDVPALSQASWVERAAMTAISPFNAYMSHNQLRWREYTGPVEADEAPGTAGAAITISSFTVTGGERNAVISGGTSAQTKLIGVAIFRDTTEITEADWSNCVHIAVPDEAGAWQWTDSPLVAGTYHYRARSIHSDGSMGVLVADASDDVT